VERDEIGQEVTYLLVAALKFQTGNRPKVAMYYCRQALECQVHAVYYDQYEQFPDKDGFKDLTNIMKKIEQHLTTQTKELLWSINASTRGSMHWSNETRGDKGAKTHHVEAVISMIKAVYQDIFSEDLIILDSSIEEKEEENVKKALERVDENSKQALQRFKQVGNLEGEAFSLGNLGDIAKTRGDQEAAHRCYTEAVSIWRQIGIPIDQWYIANGY
jgi:phosphomevalonate kinase